VRNADDKAPLHVAFATLLPLNTSKATISSSEPYYRTASAYNPPPFLRPKTTGKIAFLYIYIYISRFLDSKLEDKRFCTEWSQAFLDFNMLSISSWMEFLCVRIIPQYFNFSTLSKELFSVFILWLRPAF